MRTYKLTIAYDGSRYQGWQRQSNTDKTVQGLLEQAASETAEGTQ
ncbi:tRNA pseudouridine(38-40) synthase TruA, partial [Mediterraneibacter gnavus]